MLINFIGTIFYIFYFIFTKVKKEDSIDILFKTSSENNDNYEKYRKIKKKHMTVYIMGILIGLIYLVLTESNTTIKETVTKPSISHVTDIDDIFVK